MGTQIAADKNFLDRLPDHTDIIASIQEVAAAIAPSTQRAAAYSLSSQVPVEAQVWPAVGNVAVQGQEADMEDEVAEQKRRLAVGLFAASVADLFLPTAPLQRVLQILLMQPTYDPAYTACVAARVRERTAEGQLPSLSPRELSELAAGASLPLPQLAEGLDGALQDAEAALECLRPQSHPSSAALGLTLRQAVMEEDLWERVPRALRNHAIRLFSSSAVAVGAGVGVYIITKSPLLAAMTTATLWGKANAAEKEAARAGVSLRGQDELQGGSGEVRVNITWGADVDLDLYVTNPCGQTFGFGEQSRATCQGFEGEWDYDDLGVGYRGDNPHAENVVWEDGAPQGRYLVAVNYFNGSVPTNYTVRVFYGSQRDTYTGRIGPADGGTRRRVADFQFGAPQ